MTARRCDEALLIAFLAGDLDDEDAAEVDSHLLVCDLCWRAVEEDRDGRAAAESLRESTPAAVSANVRDWFHGSETTRRRPRARRLAAAAAAAVAVVVASVLAVRHHAPSDPASVAAVVRLAEGGTSAADAQPLQVWRADSSAGVVVVAESPSPFPMPADAHTVRLGTTPAWEARRGDIHLLCVMSPHHALLAGPVSDAELARVAGAFALIG